MNTHFPVWLHLSGAVSALTALGGMAAVFLYPDAEAAALFPVGMMGVFATSRIATDKFISRD
jgi:hypothetical protein